MPAVITQEGVRDRSAAERMFLMRALLRRFQRAARDVASAAQAGDDRRLERAVRRMGEVEEDVAVELSVELPVVNEAAASSAAEVARLRRTLAEQHETIKRLRGRP